VTPDGLTLQSTPVAIGLYDAASGKSVMIAVLTNSQGVLLDARHVLYPAALVGSLLEADAVYSLPDCGSFHQDVVITKFNGPLDPTAWGLPASATNTLRLQIFTEFYGDIPVPSEIIHPLQVETDPALRISMASPDLVDYSLGFGDVCSMSMGWAYVASTNDPASGTGSPLGGLQVAKEFVTAGQPARHFLIESIPYTSLQTGLSILPPVRTAQLSPLPGQSIRRTAMNNRGDANQLLTKQAQMEVGMARRAVRGRLGEATLPKADLRPNTGAWSSLIAANQDRADWCAALPRPSARERRSGTGILTVAKAAEANRSRTGERVVIDYILTLSGSTNSETFTNGGTYFVSGPVYVSNATIQGGAVFKYPNNEAAFLEVEEALTPPSASSARAVFTAADDNSIGGIITTSIWPSWTGTVSGYYGNAYLEVYDWSSVNVTNFSFYYGSNAAFIIGAGTSVTANVVSSLLKSCLLGITPSASSTGYVTFTATACTNINVGSAFTNNAAFVTALLTSCVFSNINVLIATPCPGSSSTWTLTNCTMQNVTNSGASSCVTIIDDDAANAGFSVNGFGAVGNGIHNDQPAISNALQAAVNWCSNVGPATLYFHGGDTYYLNSSNYNSSIPSGDYLQVPPVTNLTFASDSAATGATLTATNIPTEDLNMLTFNGPASGIVVSNLIFSNSHNPTSYQSVGIFFGENASTTWASDTLSNIFVTGCIFTGFAIGMQFDAVSNCTIYTNSFLYPLGRDSGSFTTPRINDNDNVGIEVLMFTNNTFWPGKFSVYSNYFNGLSRITKLTNSSGLMADGLIAANVDGLLCYGNTISNSGAEGILLGPIPSAPTNTCSIYSNTIAKDISLASGWGIVCDLSGAKIYTNIISNSVFGLQIGDYAGYSSTNISFYSNTVTVASSVLPYMGWAFGITTAIASNNTFYNNTFTLNLSNAVTSQLGSPPFFYNVGIAARWGSGNYYSNNTFTVSPSNYIATGTGYYGIAVDTMLLDATAGNFTNNSFLPTNGGLGNGVYAEGYPIFGTTSPNSDTTNSIQSTISGKNNF
jgi:hypothetical protein